MASVRYIFEAAPAVGDFLVLSERIGDQRERTQVLLEGLSKCFGCRFALLAVSVLQKIKRRLDRQRLAGDPEAQASYDLIILPVPRRIAGDGLLVQQTLDSVLELIGLLLTPALDPRPVMTERGCRHRGIEHGVVDSIELAR